MTITVHGDRFATGVNCGLHVGPRFTIAIEWNGAELPRVGDQMERPGAVWRVTGRSWSHDGRLTLYVDERARAS